MKSFLPSIIFAASVFLSFSAFSQSYFENFDDHPPGTLVEDLSPFWISPYGPLDNVRVFSNIGQSGNQSLGFYLFWDDLLFLLGNQTSGKYTVSWFVNIPEDVFGGGENFAFGIRKGEDINSELGMECWFSSDNMGIILTEDDFFEFTYSLNNWIEVSNFIDLDEDWIRVEIDGQEVHTWTFSQDFYGDPGLKQLGSLWFNGANGSAEFFFIDDFLFTEGFVSRTDILGKVLFDENQNCDPDPTEPGLPGFKVNFEKDGNNFGFFTNPTGIFSARLSEGLYAVNVTPPVNYWNLCAYPNEVTVPGGFGIFELEFAAKPIVECSYMTVDITAPFLRRCFPNNLYVSYCNEGTIPAEDALIYVVLDSFMNFIQSWPNPNSILGDTVYFELGTVGIGECGDLLLEVEIDCEADLGQIHCYEAHIFPDTLCVLPTREVTEVRECRENRGSFDPNDKMGFPAGEEDDHAILPDLEMKYQVRFQNTGTDTAFNVVVKDTLSVYLDAASLRMGAASHPYRVKMEEGNILKVIFENIMLPDSNVNEPASHGFFNYFILQKPNLPDGTVIENRAGIFFDFNQPILTNKVFHTIDRSVPTREVFDNEKALFTIFPNPSKPDAFIKISDFGFPSGMCEVFDNRGHLVSRFNFEEKIFDIKAPHQGAGLYFVKIIGKDGKNGIQKWLVVNDF